MFSRSAEEALDGTDVIMVLRVQKERLAGKKISLQDYIARYQMTMERVKLAKKDAMVMHPGPINRGVEIDPVLADDPKRSLITLQVEMGVAARMACLELLVGPA